MNPGDKIPRLLAPELIEKPWSGREAWRVFGIIAEFAEATERLNGVRPAVRVRGGLWARLTRSLALDLIELGEERATQDGAVFGVSAAGQFFPIGRADTGDWL